MCINSLKAQRFQAHRFQPSSCTLLRPGEGLKTVGKQQGTNRVGWYLQQYLKLGVALHIPDLSDYYLVWDADNIATQPMELFSPGNITRQGEPVQVDSSSFTPC